MRDCSPQPAAAESCCQADASGAAGTEAEGGSSASPDELALAVDNSCAVVVGASLEFCQAPMSRLLTERAHSQGREIIPILTDAQVSPSSCGWLKTVCGGRGGAAWYDFGQATQQDMKLMQDEDGRGSAGDGAAAEDDEELDLQHNRFFHRDE